MERPKVSVICSVYNHEKYLRKCLDGIVMQRTLFPIEILVNDDCSSDSSADIIREYETRYPHMFRCVYQKENQFSQGKLPWMDLQFPLAKGEYIAICEGDDYWTDSYKLQKQVDFLDKHPVFVACFHNSRVFNGYTYGLFNSLNESHYPATEDIITRRWFVSTASLMYRNILSKYPIWRKGVINEDYLLELLLAKEGRFYYMDDIMSVYRVQGQGISTVMNKNKPKMYDGLIYILSHMKEEYGGLYAEAFDKSIANYERLKNESETELYYAQHPLARAFRPKTYKRMFKQWLIKLVTQ